VSAPTFGSTEDDHHDAPLSQSPSDLAAAMSSWSPDGATLETAQSRKLLKSVDLTRAELQKSSNRIASKAITTGETGDFLLSGVSRFLSSSSNATEHAVKVCGVRRFVLME